MSITKVSILNFEYTAKSLEIYPIFPDINLQLEQDIKHLDTISSFNCCILHFFAANRSQIFAFLAKIKALMKTLSENNLPDVQSSVDPRNIDIEYVGVRGMELPVSVQSSTGLQHTVAKVGMYVGLDASKKGTHMSRFLGLLSNHQAPISHQSLVDLMQQMLQNLDASEGKIELEFPFFVKKAAPVSKLESLMNYQVRYEVIQRNGQLHVLQTTVVPVTSLCPCSKEISRYGAHNQRSHITITIRCDDGRVSLEDQIRYAEESASCALWSQLKRVDEKFVTERAYENPKFVEDLIRDVAVALNANPHILAYQIQAENFESIHNHSAYAQISKGLL